MGQVSQLGQGVIDSFPAERENIDQRTQDVKAKWEMLENKARERSKRVEDAVQLWQKMYGRQPSQETEQKIQSLGWQEKGGWLRQVHVKDFQPFKRDYREAGKQYSSTSTQAKLLENLSVGDNVSGHWKVLGQTQHSYSVHLHG